MPSPTGPLHRGAGQCDQQPASRYHLRQSPGRFPPCVSTGARPFGQSTNKPEKSAGRPVPFPQTGTFSGSASHRPPSGARPLTDSLPAGPALPAYGGTNRTGFVHESPGAIDADPAPFQSASGANPGV